LVGVNTPEIGEEGMEKIEENIELKSCISGSVKYAARILSIIRNQKLNGKRLLG